MTLKLFNDNQKGAVISECKNYRYKLWRIWDNKKPKVLFIILNPSTADENVDDPTIRRCIGFAKSWGYGGMYVGNLFAYRSTHPKELLGVENPVGSDNNYYLSEMSQECDLIICAWGNYPIINKLKINQTLLENIRKQFYCLEVSKNGTPKHPLYLKQTLKPIEYK